MKTSESIDQLSAALALAHLEIGTIPKTGVNSYFKKADGQPSKYATPSDIYDATNKPLAQNGLVVVQSPYVMDGRVFITTRLLHKSGQWIESELAIKPKDEGAQAVGSAITYGRRYAHSAIIGIVADEDDDGEAAEGRGFANKKVQNASVHVEPKIVLFTGADKELERLSSLCKKMNLAEDLFPELLEKVMNQPLTEVANIVAKFKESL